MKNSCLKLLYNQFFVSNSDLNGNHIFRQTKKIYTQRYEIVAAFVKDLRDEGLVISSPQSHAGLHVSVSLPNLTTSKEVITNAEVNGVKLSHFDDCWHGPASYEGISIGFGAITTEKLPKALTILRKVLRELIHK